MKVKIDKYPGLSVGKNGRLHFGGADLVKLGREFGTPLYVVCEEVLVDTLRSVRAAFEKSYPEVLPVFATKAMSVKAVLAMAVKEGFGLDVASDGELYGALSVKCPPEKIILHGNFKKAEELQHALAKKTGRIVLDSYEEIDMLDRIAAGMKKKAPVLLRVNPGVEAHTFEQVKVGQLDSKFGMPIETGDALEAVKRILKKKNLRFLGLHHHIGSQILEPEPFALAAEYAMEFIAEIKKRFGADVAELDIGGGFPVRYGSDHPLPAPAKFAAAICGAIKRDSKKLGLLLPKLILEPGRAIAGPGCLTLYTVGPVKIIPGVRNYVTIDGGLSDNPRPVMYDSPYEILIADNPQPKGKLKEWRVCGRHCETDKMFDAAPLPDPKPGDTLAVLTTGAYNHALSSNYNKFPRPAMVLLSRGKGEIIIKREKVEELYSHDVLPDRLKV